MTNTTLKLVNTRDRYLLEALVELAGTYPEPLTVAEIARRRDIPEPYLGRLLAGASRTGLVVTSRGRRGGVALAASPATVAIADVLPRPRAVRSGGPAVRWLTETILSRTGTLLAETSLADLLAREREANRALTWQI